VAQAFNLLYATSTLGAPSLRPLQGWAPRTHTSGAFAAAQLGQMRRNENAISRTRCCRQHRTRPCTKRKDGAPSFALASAIQRVGHPPSIPNRADFHLLLVEGFTQDDTGLSWRLMVVGPPFTKKRKKWATQGLSRRERVATRPPLFSFQVFGLFHHLPLASIKYRLSCSSTRYAIYSNWQSSVMYPEQFSSCDPPYGNEPIIRSGCSSDRSSTWVSKP